jgi:pimeloyl-ACP methyl ester carboxylesterase
VTKHDVLHYEVEGRGPVIVLLHGYLAAGSYWNAVRPALAQTHTIITIDLLGFGKSPRPKGSTYDYDNHIAWIEQTLLHIDVKKPFTLVGHSMGALLALRYSSIHPARIARLFLINPSLFKDKKEARQELSSTSLFYQVALYWRLHYLIVPVMRVKALQQLVRQSIPPEYKGMEQYMFNSSGAARHKSLRQIIESQTALDELTKITVPTTIVSGSRERATYVRNVAQVKNRPNIRIITTDTAHHTPLEDTALVVDILQQK